MSIESSYWKHGMTTLTRIELIPEPVGVKIIKHALTVILSDGRSISAPIAWFPRLLHGSARERGRFELGHSGIHWHDLDEDISIEGLLRGEKSGEAMTSLKRWLDRRTKGLKDDVPTKPLPKQLAKIIAEDKQKQRRKQK